MFDFIGDIHGHADKLEALLQKLGYVKAKGYYAHPGRKALFVGDYIDRGPKIRETLELVGQMVENESAVALMGNHEYNALCFHYKKTDGGHLRKHAIKNIIQHFETLKQFQNNQKQYEDYLQWCKSLPLFYEGENFRAVHACWDHKTIGFLKHTLQDNRLTDELIYQSANKGTQLNDAIEQTLKGKEIKMPDGLSFTDKDGTNRNEIRIKWWEDPAKTTYRNISIEPLPNLPDTPVDLSLLQNQDYYKSDEKKVFFGHYWLKGRPSLYRKNICCLDYSVAKGGYLTAYRFDGEEKLSEDNFVYV
jgi:hypothetical protein